MITKQDVIHFYEKYKENLKREEQVTAELTQAGSQEAWVEKLKQKYWTMRQLYIENEAMLNLYIRPYTNGRIEITGDVAQEYLNQILAADDDGFEDNLSMTEMAEVLVAYFRENGPLESYIQNLSLLGSLYNCSTEKEDGRKGFEYYDTICGLKDHYFEIQDYNVRKRIIFSFYNRAAILVNFFLAEADELQHYMDEALAFYSDAQVVAQDGDKMDFPGLIEELNYDVFGNYVMGHTKQNASRWFLERAEQVLEVYYNDELTKDPNPYAMPDEIYCYYRYTLFLLGKIDCTEFLEDYKRFCDYSIENDTLEHPDGFWESKLFQVAVNHLPGILECLNLYSNEYHGDATLRRQCVDAYLSIVRQFPRTGNSRFVNGVIGRSLCGFMELLAVGDVESDILINVMMNRDEITLVHSRMVSQIAELLANEVLNKKPELFTGIMGYKTVVEILENRNQIMAFISQAAKLFDVGKLKDADIVNKQSRQLTQKEMQSIYKHPEYGAEIVAKIPALAKFHDVILGHHKAWNGTMGYPENFDNTLSKDRFVIELIHISDCLDAATDFIGRSYKAQKSLEECMEEFIQGKGELYSPEIVGLMEENQNLQADLKKLLSEGRIRTYYEVYGIALDGIQDEISYQTPQEMIAESEPDKNINAVTMAEAVTMTKEVRELDGEHYGRMSAQTMAKVDEKERLISMLHESGRENQAFVQAMVRQSLLALYVDMRSGNYRVFSRGRQRLFGHLPDGKYQDFLSDYLGRIALPQDWEKLKYQLNLSELIHRLAGENGNYECEMRVLFDEGYRWVRLQFMKIDDKNVIPRTMSVLVTDVQEAHNQSTQMEQVLKEAYQTAIEANKTKSIFLSSMSHDIRTPMNGIIGMTQIAMQHLDEQERVRDCLNKIDESSRLLMEMINEVLDMSRIESGKTQLHPEVVMLRELLNGVVDVCKTGALQAKQELTVDIEALGNDCVMADPVRLRQIFMNIISNSVKYTQEKGHICVRAFKISENKVNGNCYRFEIEDNGIGMSEEFQQKLFEPFAREDNSMTNVTQGTGLGLSIVKSTIEMMGGIVEVDSKQGVGTKFTLTFQFKNAEKQQTDENEDVQELRFDGHRILLVEDNEINREIACELLSQTGLTIETATNGEEAFESFRNSTEGYYELILMDIQMPVMNGYDATRAIRNLQSDYSKNIPIIALTANIFQDDIMQALESGMNDHITKPMNMQFVGKVLAKWMKV